MLARVKATPCDDCLQPIRWWNRRIWVIHGERCAHLKCWKDQLFLKALVAGEIRRSQLMADENSASSQKGSAEHELQELHGFARARERVGMARSATYWAEELTDKTSMDEKSA